MPNEYAKKIYLILKIDRNVINFIIILILAFKKHYYVKY